MSAADKVAAAYADPLDVRAVLDLAKADAVASKNFGWWDRLQLADAAVRELVRAGQAADGTERPGRPDVSGLGADEAKAFLRGWDACAEAVYRSGLRRALAPFMDADDVGP